eukprot:1335125-Pleurochrysis_carterae.AAC.3
MAQHSAAAQFTPRREHTDAGDARLLLWHIIWSAKRRVRFTDSCIGFLAGFTGASQQQTGGRQPSANPLLFPGGLSLIDELQHALLSAQIVA